MIFVNMFVLCDVFTLRTCSEAIFTLRGSSDPIPIFSSHVAQIRYDPQMCKQEKIT